IAEIEYFVAALIVQRGNDAVDDVVNIGVVSRAAAVAEDIDRFASVNRFTEAADGEIGPLSRAVHRKESEAYYRQTINMRIGVTDLFSGDLGGGVRRDWQIFVIVLAKGNLIRYAVDGTR